MSRPTTIRSPRDPGHGQLVTRTGSEICRRHEWPNDGKEGHCIVCGTTGEEFRERYYAAMDKWPAWYRLDQWALFVLMAVTMALIFVAMPFMIVGLALNVATTILYLLPVFGVLYLVTLFSKDADK